MGMLDRFEKKVESAVNNVFAKAFRSEVKPVEIASAVRREMDDRAAAVSRGRTVVPNEFTVTLSPADRERVDAWGAEALAAEMVTAATEHADSQQYAFVGPVRVRFQTDESVSTGRLSVESATRRGTTAPATSTAASTRHPIIDIDGQRYLLTGPVTVIGRGSEADIIVAAGGDGTATALAGALVGTGRTLGILPLGTANLLARDLAMPLDLDAALAALLDMQPRQIDVGEVNGRIFLHKVVVGFVPAIAAGREHMRGRSGVGAQFGFLRYFLRRLARVRRLALEIAPREGEGQVRVERVPAVAVANNSYDQGLGQVFSRPRLDAGHLGLYVVRRLALTDVVRLSAEMLLGRWQEDEALQIETVTEVTLRTRRRTITAMIDGEVERLRVPLRFRIRPLALSVLAPVAAGADDSGAPAAARA